MKAASRIYKYRILRRNLNIDKLERQLMEVAGCALLAFYAITKCTGHKLSAARVKEKQMRLALINLSSSVPHIINALSHNAIVGLAPVLSK